MDCKGKFYTYENYPNNYIMIHQGECSRCNCGNGVQREILRGQNGRWSGPFNNYVIAHTHSTGIEMPRVIKDCKFCKPQ